MRQRAGSSARYAGGPVAADASKPGWNNPIHPSSPKGSERHRNPRSACPKRDRVRKSAGLATLAVYKESMARKTNRRRYLIQGSDVRRITGLKWTTIQYIIWRSRFRWNSPGGKVKLGKAKHPLKPVQGRPYSIKAVWDVNVLLAHDPRQFRKLGTQNAWTRLHYDLNDFDD